MTDWAMESHKQSNVRPASYQTVEQALRDLQAGDYKRWMLATKGSFFELREEACFLP